MSGSLLPISWIYSSAMKLRNLYYDRSEKSSQKFDKPIVSVGNLTMGGTGKTPVISALVEWCLSNNIKPGIVSRGYKGHFEGPQRVDFKLSENPAYYYGDEPTMLAKIHQEVPVYVCPKRTTAVEALLAENQVDIVLADLL